MLSSDLSVWLCDLTYTQQSIMAETMPMAIGCIATYTESNIQFNSPIRLFKYPEKLGEAFDLGPRWAIHVVGHQQDSNLSSRPLRVLPSRSVWKLAICLFVVRGRAAARWAIHVVLPGWTQI